MSCSSTTKNANVHVSFDSAQGIREKSAVFCRGIEVGNVKSIAFQNASLVLELEIRNPNLKLHRSDCVEIMNAGLLGDKIIQITPGDPTAQRVDPGYILKGMETTQYDLLRMALTEIINCGPNEREKVINKWREVLSLTDQGNGAIRDLKGLSDKKH